MKFIILNQKIVCLATDDYVATGTETVVAAPTDFDIQRVADYRYDGTDWTFYVSPVLLTPLQFLRRFTLAERIAVRNAMNPIIMDFLNLISLAQDIQTTDPDTQMGIGYLAQQGLIAPERIVELLA
jgi:hypothetical protein